MLGRACLGVVLAVALTACAETTDTNLLQNGGFTSGDEPWASHTRGVWNRRAFDVVTEPGSGDNRAASVMLLSAQPHQPRQLMGVIQDVTPRACPRYLRGRYFVADWRRGTAHQYVQVVVIAFGADNAPAGMPNHQLRISLAGIAAPAFEVRNAKWVFVGPREPQAGRWVDFDLDLHTLFREHWGEAPRGFDKLRVLFEARWDGAKENDGPTRAVVLFDDLYLGD